MIGSAKRAWSGTALVAVALALAGCGDRETSERKLDSLDKELVGANGAAGTDPALTAALEDQIMVDPALAAQANGGSPRPAPGGTSMPIPAEQRRQTEQARYAMANGRLLRAPEPTAFEMPGGGRPVTLGQMADQQKGANGQAAGCARRIDYSARWAARMPGQFPVYPQARVVEAAGADEPRCAMRIVTFRTDAAVQPVLDYYYTQALRAGFSAEHQSAGSEHVLGGARGDSAMILFARPQQGGGTEVDLVVRIS